MTPAVNTITVVFQLSTPSHQLFISVKCCVCGAAFLLLKVLCILFLNSKSHCQITVMLSYYCYRIGGSGSFVDSFIGPEYDC